MSSATVVSGDEVFDSAGELGGSKQSILACSPHHKHDVEVATDCLVRKHDKWRDTHTSRDHQQSLGASRDGEGITEGPEHR
jgi:hypothetical protein